MMFQGIHLYGFSRIPMVFLGIPLDPQAFPSFSKGFLEMIWVFQLFSYGFVLFSQIFLYS